MKRFFTSLSIALGLSLLYAGIVYAQGETPPAETVQTGDIAAKLAGLVAAATVIERIIETFWDFIENNFLTASKAVGNASNYADWAKQQVQAARTNLFGPAAATNNNSALETALKDAEKRLSDYLQSPVYVSRKKKFSVPLAIVLGLVIAHQAQLQILFLLDLLPSDSNFKPIDMIITGLIIGTGSAPVHSLIGILQKTRDTVDAARAMYSGKALTDAADAIKKLNAPQSATTLGSLRNTINLFGNSPDDELVSAIPTQSNSIELERAARRLVNL
jgi:hypothetical protein